MAFKSVNPDTNRPIKSTGEIYKNLETLCHEFKLTTLLDTLKKIQKRMKPKKKTILLASVRKTI